MDEENYLFDINALPKGEVQNRFKFIEVPIWTENKAKFIARYLKAFTFVTKHGTYIDAFAGPQHTDSRDSTWAAKLVLENQPMWLRNFHLFDLGKEQVEHLRELRRIFIENFPEQASKRKISVIPGDCNETVPRYLIENPIRDREATFCLLDQRTFECNWETVKTISQHKSGDGVNKIELFYFLAQGWMDRSLKHPQLKTEKILRWWGRNDIQDFMNLSSFERGQLLANRFKEELHYKYSYAFPIQKAGKEGRIMFWMIHATDHDTAPFLMHQAYRHVSAGGGLDAPYKQDEMDLD